ncbi:kinase-like domain-containing protein [Gigaspora rosea]|uniref:Kinase-like domain-containing protein n=1 Tax=Gigaspora rosea TaxID=44941 RepID=A0A397W914_9GLOM|nr:kinase-like domain-containing protein [Gigaspora rosea]
MYKLGYCYEYGIGTEKDENQAFKYYKKSADMNNPKGIYQVGYCYYLGIGVEIYKHKAFTYYLKSAEAGNSMGIWKTAICYFYGIGVEKNFDKFLEWIKKQSEYGKCAYCNYNNTSEAWCLSCDPDIAIRRRIPISINAEIDDCIREFQLRIFKYEDVSDWIPFDRLSNVKEIGKGGFGSVYKATWLDGKREIKKIKDGDSYIYERACEQSSIVAFKTLSSSKEKEDNNFLKEFKNLLTCKLNANKLAIYGITKNIKTNEYMMVFQYADKGSLNKYLRKNLDKLTWQTRLQILKDISEELDNIHRLAGYIHADFHSGNILQGQHTNENMRAYIEGLGLSRKKDECISESDIYGVMPYVAPEVLLGNQQFTQAADIYGFGIIMVEISTGQRPFDGHKFDSKLAVKICRGLRPELASGTPNCYVELAKQCMHSDPQERPNALDIYRKIRDWLNDLNSSNNEIKKQFLDADKIVKSLPASKHPDEMYTSKLISTKLISNEFKSLLQTDSTDSAQLDLDIVKS